MFNTGLGVQEIVTLHLLDVQLQTRRTFTCSVKGAKNGYVRSGRRLPKSLVRSWPNVVRRN
jgi:site-specific recombinase XerD